MENLWRDDEAEKVFSEYAKEGLRSPGAGTRVAAHERHNPAEREAA